MSHSIFQNPKYANIMQEHINQVLHFLLEEDSDFSVACKVEHISFTPILPANITETFNESVLFVLSGYTRESAGIDDDEGYFSFEAGFGSENIGSRLMLPILSIQQIFVNEQPIILNFIDYSSLKTPHAKSIKGSEKTSMEALLNNPKNKKLLNKKAKS